MTERQLQDAVLECAAAFKWRSAHFRAARTARGWRTPVEGDGKGFPDLVLLRGERLVVAELKSAKEKPTEAQLEWLHAFEPVAETYLWRPEDWVSGEIEKVLR